MDNKIFYLFQIVLLISVNGESSFVASEFVTQTVYGFLDFITTIGNTVMVFSPESAPALDFKENKIEPVKVIETKPIKNILKDSDSPIKPTKLVIVNSSKSKNSKQAQSEKTNTQISSEYVLPKKPSEQKINEIQNSQAYIESNLYKPEYDLLSRQPTEYIEETYKLVNISPSLRTHSKFRNSNSAKICDYERESGKKHEANVVGSCVSSKHSQGLHSTQHAHKNVKPKSSSSISPRILKTAAPLVSRANKEEHSVSTGTSLHRKSGLSKRFRNRISSSPTETVSPAQKTTERLTSHGKPKKSSTRSKSKRRNKHSRMSDSEKNVASTTSIAEENVSRRSFRLKTHASPTETDTSSSLYMFKLNRTPGRWQYKTSPKPKVVIRKPASSSSISSTYFNNTAPIADIKKNANAQPTLNNSINVDLESSGSQNGAVINNADFEESPKFIEETLNVEISTPPDFHDTYYEIATIKTPYTFQAGVVKKTRFITVTSTFEKILEPEITASTVFEGPLTENILTISAKSDQLQLDGSITTLLPIYLTDTEETPSLEVVTESYTKTQTKLGTQVLPIVRDGENSTSYLTAVQTYDITKLITVTRTVLPQESNQFIPSKDLKDFNINLDTAGSEINIDLDFEDENHSDYARDDEINTEHFSNNSTVNTSTKPSSLNQKQLQQLALLNMFNPVSQQPTLLASRPVVKIETLWQSHVIPVINGHSTSYRTLSKSVGIVDKTEYEPVSSTVEHQLSVNPYLLPAPQQFQTITSPLVHQTIVTETNSKVLKLTFGAKTAYTTLFSTQVLPKIVTTFVTTSIPVQPTVAFPGYFPPPYPPYPYVG